MELVQRFRLYQAPGAFGAEWVCAEDNCKAPMVVAAPDAEAIGEPASDGEAIMSHARECRYSQEVSG